MRSIVTSFGRVKFLHSYYDDFGIRELCHAAKDGHSDAIDQISIELRSLNLNKKVIPIPSSSGVSIVNSEIIKRSGLTVLDLIKGSSREDFIFVNRKGIVPGPDFFGYELDKQKLSGNEILFDVVMGSGTTIEYAVKLFDSIPEILVYAVDLSDREYEVLRE